MLEVSTISENVHHILLSFSFILLFPCNFRSNLGIMIRFGVVIALFIIGEAQGFLGHLMTCKELIGKVHIGEEAESITTPGLQQCRKRCLENSDCVGLTHNSKTIKCQLFRYARN